MENFDAAAELARIKALRETKRYRRSKLDKFRGEILALEKAGASCADIALWLREHKIKADGSTVSRYLAKQKALLATSGTLQEAGKE
jgi:hypothetical protein